MAGEGAQQFLDHLCNDAALRAQFRATGATKANAILDFALSKGYTLTEAELRAVLKDAPEHIMVEQLCELLKVPRAKPTHTS
jgi:Nif11 domain